MFHWKKLGRVFDPTSMGEGRPWMSEFAQGPCTLVRDDTVRVYFSCRPPADESGQYCSRSAYLDLRRDDLMQVVDVARAPMLELGGLGEFDEFGTYPVSVLPDVDEIVAYYGGWTRCESVPFDVAIGMARSRDGGATFEKVGKGPVLGASLDEPFVLSGPKIRRYGGLWYLFYIAGRRWVSDQGRLEPVYKIRMATSSDGLHWNRQGRDLIESRLDEDEAQASPDVFFSGGRYHMFFSYRHGTGYRGKERGYRIGYAFSDDLVGWTRDDSRAGIDVSETGWDSEMLSYAHVFDLDQTTYMMYLGNQVGRYGFGLARLEGQL